MGSHREGIRGRNCWYTVRLLCSGCVGRLVVAALIFLCLRDKPNPYRRNEDQSDRKESQCRDVAPLRLTRSLRKKSYGPQASSPALKDFGHRHSCLCLLVGLYTFAAPHDLSRLATPSRAPLLPEEIGSAAAVGSRNSQSLVMLSEARAPARASETSRECFIP
jgi:hypothetical protein